MRTYKKEKQVNYLKKYLKKKRKRKQGENASLEIGKRRGSFWTKNNGWEVSLKKVFLKDFLRKNIFRRFSSQKREGELKILTQTIRYWNKIEFRPDHIDIINCYAEAKNSKEYPHLKKPIERNIFLFLRKKKYFFFIF